MFKPSQSYYTTFTTQDATGAATNAASTPTATARKNGATDGSFTLTVTNLSTGLYSISGTVPAGYAAGDVVQIEVSATIGSTTAKAKVHEFVVDTVRASDIQSRIGTNGSGLTALGDTRIANLDATVSSRSTYGGGDTAGTTTLLARLTSGRATNLDNLDATVSSRSTYAGGDTSGVTTLLARLTATRAGFLDNLDAAISSRLASASYTAPDNTNIGVLIARLTAVRAGLLDNLDAAVSSRSTYAGADTAGTTTLLGRLTSTRAGNLDNLDATLSSRATQTSVDTVAGYVDTEIGVIKTTTDKLGTALEVDGGVYRFTANALEQAPTGSGGTVLPTGSDGRVLLSGDAHTSGATVAAVTGNVVGSVGSVTGNVGGSVASVSSGVTVTTNYDKGGYSLATTPPTAAQIRTELDANSTKLANLDGTISSRASQTSVNAIPTSAQNAEAVRDNIFDIPDGAQLIVDVDGNVNAATGAVEYAVGTALTNYGALTRTEATADKNEIKTAIPSASTIATAVWGATTRTLSAFGFSVTVATNNDKSGYSLATAPPTAAQIRTELDANSTKLANLDATIASRSSQESVNALSSGGSPIPTGTDGRVLLSADAHTTGAVVFANLDDNDNTQKFDFLDQVRNVVDGVSVVAQVSDFTPEAGELVAGFVEAALGNASTSTSADVINARDVITAALPPAPNNAAIAAIKTQTDKLPNSPAATTDIPSANQNATAVWGFAGVRSLTTFGSLVADIATSVWGFTGGRLLSGFNFTVNTNPNSVENDIKNKTDLIGTVSVASKADVQVNVNPTPVTVNPTPVTVNPTPVTVNPTPITVNPTPVTVNGGFTDADRTSLGTIATQTTRLDGLLETTSEGDRFKEVALETAPSGGGNTGGYTDEDRARDMEAAENVAFIRTRQAQQVPEPTPILSIPASADPDKVFVRVRTADFLGKPLPNIIVKLILDDTGNVVINGAFRLTRFFSGVTKLHTDENGNSDAYVDIEVWKDTTLADAGLNPVYILDMAGVENYKIRVTGEGGLASALRVD